MCVYGKLKMINCQANKGKVEVKLFNQKKGYR